MKGFKKLTAGLMGVVMALGVCGFTAFAADGIDTEDELISALKNNTTEDVEIELAGDIPLTKEIVIGGNRDVTIDLGGHTLTGVSNSKVFQFGTLGKDEGKEYENTGSLTLENGTITGYVGIVNCFGEVYLEDGLEIDTTEEAVVSYGGTVEVNGA